MLPSALAFCACRLAKQLAFTEADGEMSLHTVAIDIAMIFA